ncbi:MraY family glycosyltransferase [Propionibacterium freudenreichii]|uniref:MraY family glycosyltransferase n=1 Tax=Propionibacterium freudenreichii TaxID=1744 RepID=UPI001109B012|nr:MraY family glycosyltransferase [Propionibacterium freudenreichii]MCT2976294.1 undecaprenyl/decaprenyl-phosphate alpha-N-acetylglucosaminyl 1-phosphate transferase [Propionibacterium freudenreichii]MDK9298533.1 undecaprenyl/decaprenyl-phosphate alpha-N-acetylglucosaminyl 1-phosphate transferase [Propionibacterium freudenreichii]MDK9351019.1 undecaprenyl/decaprenyl-phosphate alpha-N-acetylglucosaminyl 1-phosphate transferase [Propionibacterium freudenreichii]
MREYLLVMLTAFAATYLFAGLCRRVAIRTGAMAPVRERDVHATPTPYLGGVAMLVGVGAAFLLAAHMPFLGRHLTVSRDALGIFLAALVICVIGAIDDAIDLPWMAKIAGQVLAAGVAVLNGVRMYWVSLPHQIFALDEPTSILITVLYIFVCVNAINLIDGLDGLAAGVVGIGSLAMFVYTYLLAYQQQFVVATTASLVTATIAGICAGFLPHNFFRAKMFMGDSGAMLLGLLLACSTLSLTGQIDSSALTPSRGDALPALLPIVLPIAIMALPLIDMTMAYIRRTWNGNWWFVADKKHLHHRLLQRGHSQIKAVLIMYMWTAIIAFGVIALGLAWYWPVILAVAVAIAIAIVLTVVPMRQPKSPARRLVEPKPVER